MSEEAYSGVLGAVPYAVRRSESRLFRAYAVLGGLLAALLAVFFTLALVNAIAESVGGGSLSGYRALVLLFGLAVGLPVVGPILLVARRHRRAAERGGRPPDRGYDSLMGVLGVAALLSVYAALIISAPERFQSEVRGPLAVVATALYDAPAAASPLPPVVVVVAMLTLDRLYGPPDADAETAT
jgi:hypothetical protein